MAAITISRQYGSGGRKVALRVSEILGWPLFDKRLMMKVASDVGLSPSDIVDFTEDDYTAKSFWDRLFSSLGSGYGEPTGGHYVPSSGDFTAAQMDEEGAVRLVNKAIDIAYQRGNVIIVGRGGQVLLQDKRDVLHVRVQAPMEMRKSRLESYEDVKREDTESIAIERDRAGSQYMKRFFKVDLENPELYHLVINSEKMDTEAISQLIVSTVKQFFTVTA
jgi:CMP/dCMP kinase